MFLVFLLGFLIVAVEFISKFADTFHAFGHDFPPAVLIIPLICPLRDLIQQRHKRFYAIAAMLIAVIAFYFTTGLRYEIAAAGALIWSELVDFGLYTYFRRFGWLVGLVVSDIVAVPILLPLYAFLAGYPISAVHRHLYIAEYIVLLAVYVLILATPIKKLFTGIPMVGRKGLEV